MPDKPYIIYTALFGDTKDELYPPEEQSDLVECIAYVDEPRMAQFKGKGWQLRPAYYHDENPRRRARHHKCGPHELFPKAAYSMWIDGCLTPLQDLREMTEYLLPNEDMAVFEHMERGCVYKELEACIRLKKDNPELMRRQVQRYREQKYPYDNGLAETTAVLRRHCDEIRRFNNAWWTEIDQFSLRDQLSFDFVCWQSRIDYAWLEGTRTESPHFQWRPHR